VRRALLAAALLAACRSAPAGDPAADARRADESAVVQFASEIDGPDHAGWWVVVQDGAVAAAGVTPDEAVRAVPEDRAAPAHRFVFRPTDRGPREYRMAYLAEGGIVAGRRFLADLGLETVGLGPDTSLRRAGGNRAAPLAGGRRFTFEIAAPGVSAHRTLTAVLDPDFDGALVLPRPVARELGLERFEVPGTADVQVALARPFRAHRATAHVRIAELDTGGLAEVLFETAPLKH
jgi:hypothetical protein